MFFTAKFYKCKDPYCTGDNNVFPVKKSFHSKQRFDTTCTVPHWRLYIHAIFVEKPFHYQAFLATHITLHQSVMSVEKPSHTGHILALTRTITY